MSYNRLCEYTNMSIFAYTNVRYRTGPGVVEIVHNLQASETRRPHFLLMQCDRLSGHPLWFALNALFIMTLCQRSRYVNRCPNVNTGVLFISVQPCKRVYAYRKRHFSIYDIVSCIAYRNLEYLVVNFKGDLRLYDIRRLKKYIKTNFQDK